MTPGSTGIQSFPKAAQYLTNLPPLLWLQWYLSCFVISLRWLLLRHFSTLREASGIFEWGLFQVTPKTIWQNWHDPGSGSVTQDQQENWMDYTCVSFGEECIWSESIKTYLNWKYDKNNFIVFMYYLREHEHYRIFALKCIEKISMGKMLQKLVAMCCSANFYSDHGRYFNKKSMKFQNKGAMKLKPFMSIPTLSLYTKPRFLPPAHPKKGAFIRECSFDFRREISTKILPSVLKFHHTLSQAFWQEMLFAL